MTKPAGVSELPVVVTAVPLRTVVVAKNVSLTGVSVDVAVVWRQPIEVVDVAEFVVVTVSVPARVRAPAELNVEVAEPPKYAVPKTESLVEDACPNVARPVCVEAPVSVVAPVTDSAPSVVMSVLIVVVA